jgi:hypothetical protein
MLHVATHGFYGWRAGFAGAATRSPATRGPWPDPLRGHIGALPPPTHDLSDGLDQAGLAMADANWEPAGIVTAREIAGFDWTGTQLVVLSACQTGLGALWHLGTASTACGGRWCSPALRRRWSACGASPMHRPRP